jgi:Actinobacteria/chloroflexi VLRF1 release factor
VKNVAGSGGKWLDVSAERFPGWIASFSLRHGLSAADGAAEAGRADDAEQEPAGPGAALLVTFGDDHASFTAEDGSVAECYPPFPPPGGAATLAANAGADCGADPAGPATRADVAAIAEAFAAHARRPRTVGVLLVRLGGYAAGVFAGYPPALQDAKVGSRLVHGRSAAGGWSQHRFARRREKQANEALDAAAAAAVLIFGKRATTRRPQPTTAGLDAVVLGGDRRAVAELRDDPRLALYFQLAAERFLTVPDPKRAVLLETPRLFTAVRIRLTET